MMCLSIDGDIVPLSESITNIHILLGKEGPRSHTQIERTDFWRFFSGIPFQTDNAGALQSLALMLTRE